MGTYKISCPVCQQSLEVQDEWSNQQASCPSCHQTFTIPPRPVEPLNLSVPQPIPSSPEQHGIISVVPFGPGKFNVAGDYFALYSCVKQVLQDCQVSIREDNPEQGRIAGNCKYGINMFGIAVTAIMYLNGNAMTLELSASLADAFDTMGVCAKKISEISDLFLQYYPSFQTSEMERPAHFPLLPPAYAQRAGESYEQKAKVSFYVGLFGLLVAIVGILALIFGIMALNGMSSSRNEAGKGFAIAGVVLGGIEIAFMLIFIVIL